MHIDENQEWLVDCQKLIAVAEWIKDGAASNIVAVLCEVTFMVLAPGCRGRCPSQKPTWLNPLIVI